MGVIKETVFHYTCDGKGCKENGALPEVPQGWMFFYLAEPKKTKTMRGLLCPTCIADIMHRVSPQRLGPSDEPSESATNLQEINELAVKGNCA